MGVVCAWCNVMLVLAATTVCPIICMHGNEKGGRQGKAGEWLQPRAFATTARAATLLYPTTAAADPYKPVELNQFADIHVCMGAALDGGLLVAQTIRLTQSQTCEITRGRHNLALGRSLWYHRNTAKEF
jgi:hypothetical protein